MKNQIIIFGIEAEYNIITLKHNQGILKEIIFKCANDVKEFIIKEAVKRGFPFERTELGVNIYQ